MPSSKLKQYVDTIKLLMKSDPLTFKQITALSRVNSSALKKQLKFLVNEGIIKKKDTNPDTTYIVTMKGIRILKYFKVLPSVKIAIEKA